MTIAKRVPTEVAAFAAGMLLEGNRETRGRPSAERLNQASPLMLALLGACGGGGGGAGTIPAPPTITGQADSVAFPLGSTSITGNVLANDTASSGTLTVAGITLPGGTAALVGEPISFGSSTLTLNVNGAFTFVLLPTFDPIVLPGGRVVDFNITYTPAVDGQKGAPQPLTIRLTGINDAPVVDFEVPDVSVSEGAALSLSIPGNAFRDPDNGATFTISARLANGGALPSWMTFTAAPAELTGTPGPNDSGIYTVRIIATDAEGLVAFQDVEVRVDNVLTGVVADGYLRSATVFIDRNGDGQISAGEPVALTDANGQFRLVSELVGNLRAINGFNTDTGLANTVDLTALTGATVINPLTTLVHAVALSGQGANSAQEAVRSALGLSPTIDLNHFDILAQAPTSGVALAAQKASAIVANVIGQVENFFGNGSMPGTEAAIVRELAKLVGTAAPIDLTNPATIAQIYTSTGLLNADLVSKFSLGAAAINQKIALASSFSGIAEMQLVAGQNKVPSAGNDVFSTSEDAVAVLEVRGNDIDPDAGALTVAAINRTMIAAGQTVGVGNGTVTLLENGKLSFAPSANFNGSIFFEYTLSDGQGATAVANVTVNVAPVPDAPALQADVRSIGAGAAPISGNVLVNDANPDGGLPLTVVGIKGPSGATGQIAQPVTGAFGTLLIQADGSFSYQVADNSAVRALKPLQTATDVFTYSAAVGAQQSTSTLTIQVVGINDAPVATALGSSTPFTTPFTSAIFGAFATFDADGDQITVTGIRTENAQAGVGQILTGPIGSFRIFPDRTYEYFPTAAAASVFKALPAGQQLTDQFFYTISDGTLTSEGFFLRVYEGVNDSPTALNDAGLSVTEDDAISIVSGNVLANDSDPDTGTSLAVSAINGVMANVGQPVQGTYGSIVVNTNGSFTYTLNNADPDTDALTPGQAVTESFGYSISDGSGGGAAATLSITINGAPNQVTGTSGNDTLAGTGFPDIIFGLEGDDVLSGLGGADTLDGGTGTDTASYASAAAGVRVSLNNPSLNLGDAAGDKYVSIERVLGSDFNDTLLGDGGANVLLGGAGDDRIAGGDGADTLEGGNGSDKITGGLGADRIDGGEGFDYADYEFAPEAVSVDLASSAGLAGDAAGDELIAVEGLIGSQFDDTLLGDAGSNVILGNSGNDTITGGGGADFFAYYLLTLDETVDTITDFERGVDKLRLFGGDKDADFTFVSGASPLPPNVSDATYLYNTETGILSYSVLAGGIRPIAYFPDRPALDVSDLQVLVGVGI